MQIQAYLDNVFDVGVLLEDTETKNAVLEHMEELQEQVTLVRGAPERGPDTVSPQVPTPASGTGLTTGSRSELGMAAWLLSFTRAHILNPPGSFSVCVRGAPSCAGPLGARGPLLSQGLEPRP